MKNTLQASLFQGIIALTLLLAVASFAGVIPENHDVDPSDYIDMPETVKGTPNVLVILVDFENIPFEDGIEEEFDKYLNKEGFVNEKCKNYDNNECPSAREFFNTISNGNFIPKYDVQKPIRLSKPFTSAGDYTTYANQEEIVNEAIDSLKAREIDFSIYDEDGDGELDYVQIVVSENNDVYSIKFSDTNLKFDTPLTLNSFILKKIAFICINDGIDDIEEDCDDTNEENIGPFIGNYFIPRFGRIINPITYILYNNVSYLDLFVLGWKKDFPLAFSKDSVKLTTDEYILLPTNDKKQYFILRNFYGKLISIYKVNEDSITSTIYYDLSQKYKEISYTFNENKEFIFLKNIETNTDFTLFYITDEKETIKIPNSQSIPLPEIKSYTTGEHHVLVLLMQYADVKFKSENPQQQFDNFFNKEGYNENNNVGSVRDYFIANSNGKFIPHFDVQEPITIEKNQDNCTYDDQSCFTEVIDTLVAHNFDFSTYNVDNDNVIDFVIFIYASHRDENMTTLWPHQNRLYYPVNSDIDSINYACANELNSTLYYKNTNSSVIDGIGAITHEFLHILGLRDHYGNYDDNIPWFWDIMASGNYNINGSDSAYKGTSPANLNAFEKMSLGWLTPKVLTVNDTITKIRPIQTDDAYVIQTPDSNNYFILEYRNQKDFDRGLPNHGLLIWRINYDEDFWNYNNINKYKEHIVLLPADDTYGSDNLADDAYPGPYNVTTVNNFKTNDGYYMDIELYDITEDENQEFVTFRTRTISGGSSSSEIAESSSSSGNVESESSSSSNDIESSSAEKQAIEIAANNTPKGKFHVENGDIVASINIAGVKQLKIFDMNGVLVKNKFFVGDECRISKSELEAGKMLLAVIESNGQAIAKRRIFIRNAK